MESSRSLGLCTLLLAVSIRSVSLAVIIKYFAYLLSFFPTGLETRSTTQDFLHGHPHSPVPGQSGIVVLVVVLPSSSSSSSSSS